MLFGILCMLAIQSLLIVALICHAIELKRDVRSNILTLQRKVITMSAAFDNLKAAVAAQTAVDASAVTLIQGIAEKLRTAGSDVDLQALADQLSSAAKPLADAVTANTPVAPAA